MLTARERAYAHKFARNVLGVSTVAIPNDVLEACFRAIARREESENPMRDEFGNWSHTVTSERSRATLHRPVLDESLQQLHSGVHFSGANRRPAWPDGHSFALCLTHDVDFISSTAQGRKFVRRLSRAIRGDGPRAVPLRAAAGSIYRLFTGVVEGERLGDYGDWLAMEARHGFRSTFYFFPSTLSRPHAYDCDYHFDDPMVFQGRSLRAADVMRVMADAGWEVGLHGSYHSATYPGLLDEQRREVEMALQRPVRSVRQHYLRYDAAVTPRLQAAAGLVCDSTQGFNRITGFRAGTSFPYWCWDASAGDALPLLEIPLSVMDVALFASIDAKNAEAAAVEQCIAVMDAVQAVGGCMVLNWHPNYLTTPMFRSVYAALLEEGKHRNAWGCSAGDIYDWWIAREAALEAEAHEQTHLTH